MEDLILAFLSLSPPVINEHGIMKITIFFIASRYPRIFFFILQALFREVKMRSALHFSVVRMLLEVKAFSLKMRFIYFIFF